MVSDLNRKIQKAYKLRQKAPFPFSLFQSPDFIEAGELFCEVAIDSNSSEEKSKFYIEAANTFLLKNDEYGEFKASECYRKLYEILESEDIEKALDYYTLYGDLLEKMSKFLNSGQIYTKIGDALLKIDLNRAAKVYSKANYTFKKDRANCVAHLKACLQKQLQVQLNLGNLEESLEIIGQLEMKFSKLCQQILSILCGRTDFDDVLSSNENRLIMAIVNKSKEEAVVELENFRNDNFLPDIVSKIFDIAIEKLGPDNDIC